MTLNMVSTAHCEATSSRLDSWEEEPGTNIPELATNAEKSFIDRCLNTDFGMLGAHARKG